MSQEGWERAMPRVGNRGTSLIRKQTPYDPKVGLCLGPYDSPSGGAVSYERGAPHHAEGWVPTFGWVLTFDLEPQTLSPTPQTLKPLL